MIKKSLMTIVLLGSCLITYAENVTILGIGRLGLCTALVFERAGYHVTGVDVAQSYVDAINNKTLKSPEPQVEEYLAQSKNFKATTSLDEGLNFSDIIYIMIATPSTPTKEAYDHSSLSKLLADINKRKVQNKHIVIGCTIFPGYIDKVGNYLLQDCENTTLSYNPEFIAQGTIIRNFEHPDMVLIGEGSSVIGDRLEELYKNICLNEPLICRMSPASAEITKLSVNCFITTKIAYANFIGDLADQTPGANKLDILRAVGGDKRVGCLCLKPGYGFGGPCFPRDNRALGSYAQQVGITPRIPCATDDSNRAHTEFMAEQFLAQNKEEYIFEDVTYKENCAVPIIEESQKLAVAEILAKKGKRVTIKGTETVINMVQQTFGSLFEYSL